ncbi:hypothetical protein V6N13_147281 [Hibiscus sabdariffa]|uniref:Uncharacterized protein n=1 Tax=Hibiscus sabdariffa TaxID=183260 RepID=A0ABR2TV07_9ROSI
MESRSFSSRRSTWPLTSLRYLKAMSDYTEGKDSDFFGLNDDNLASDSSSPTPGQHFGDWTSPLSLYDDPMQYINLSPHDFDTGPGEDIQQPEYATMEVPSGANEPGDTPLKDQNLSPGEDIQHATTEVQSGANAPPLSPVDDQENLSSSKSTGSKKRKSATKGKGKGKGMIRRRNQGTFCIGESSNSKQPEKPTKEPDKYEEPIKDKDENESEIEDAKKELIKIEEKSSKFIEDLDKAKKVLSEGLKEVRNTKLNDISKFTILIKLENQKEQAKKETKEARQVLEENKMLANERSQELKITRIILNEVVEMQEKETEKTRKIEPIFANSMFASVCPPDLQGIFEMDDPNPQQWTQVPQEDRGQNAEENVNVEVPTEEASGQQLQSYDEQISGLDYRIYILRMRANQHLQDQQLQVLIDRQVEALVAQRDVLVGMRAILHAQAL